MTQGCCGGGQSDNEESGSMMPDMAKKMMNKMQGGDFNPQEMCQNMMQSIKSTAKLAGNANPEVQMLFEEWVAEVEQEVLELLKNQDELNIAQIAEKLKINQDSVRYFISKLIRDEKVKITALKVL
ncbi:MAG: PCI domain-containing protein [Bacillota bacterium]